MRTRTARWIVAMMIGGASSLAAGAILHGAEAAEFTVDSTADEADASPVDGVCRTASGLCTLRAAVKQADFSVGSGTTVVLPAGRFTFARPITWPLPSQTADLEANPADGDLDVFTTLTVRGAGAGTTIIDPNGLDRAFNVEPNGSLALSDLTITNGDATTNRRTDFDIALGGAVLTTGALTVERVALVGNRADGGGGIFATPFTHFTVRDSLIANNTAVEGGGLRVDGGATIVNTTITGNSLFVRELGKSIPDEITGWRRSCPPR